MPRNSCHRQPSDPSGAAEADRHLVSVDDDRHIVPPGGMLQHPAETLGVSLDVDVVDLETSRAVILTGGRGVRSSVFTEDLHDRFRHVDSCAAGSARRSSSAARSASGIGIDRFAAASYDTCTDLAFATSRLVDASTTSYS